ncbi:hypothetical protein C8R45DRAFT_947164 [Mycena sanguinolenta]|nr:hypothetical protein C8R45DRAFT_947164 [Mycena sanguinolenta]
MWGKPEGENKPENNIASARRVETRETSIRGEDSPAMWKILAAAPGARRPSLRGSMSSMVKGDANGPGIQANQPEFNFRRVLLDHVEHDALRSDEPHNEHDPLTRPRTVDGVDTILSHLAPRPVVLPPPLSVMPLRPCHAATVLVDDTANPRRSPSSATPSTLVNLYSSPTPKYIIQHTAEIDRLKLERHGLEVSFLLIQFHNRPPSKNGRMAGKIAPKGDCAYQNLNQGGHIAVKECSQSVQCIDWVDHFLVASLFGSRKCDTPGQYLPEPDTLPQKFLPSRSKFQLVIAIPVVMASHVLTCRARKSATPGRNVRGFTCTPHIGAKMLTFALSMAAGLRRISLSLGRAANGGSTRKNPKPSAEHSILLKRDEKGTPRRRRLLVPTETAHRCPTHGNMGGKRAGCQGMDIPQVPEITPQRATALAERQCIADGDGRDEEGPGNVSDFVKTDSVCRFFCPVSDLKIRTKQAGIIIPCWLPVDGRVPSSITFNRVKMATGTVRGHELDSNTKSWLGLLENKPIQSQKDLEDAPGSYIESLSPTNTAIFELPSLNMARL